MLGNKLVGWVGVVAGFAAVLVEARHVVGETVANVAQVLAVIIAGIGGPILGKSPRSD